MSRAARPYADALYSVAEAHHKTDAWDGAVGDWLERLSPEARRLLASPVAPTSAKRVLLQALAGDDADPLLQNFLNVLADHRRADELPDVVRRFHELVQAQSGSVEATVEAATDLEPAQRQALEKAVARLAGGKQVSLSVERRPDLLGGVRVRVADRVYDGSLAGKLARLQRAVG